MFPNRQKGKLKLHYLHSESRRNSRKGRRQVGLADTETLISANQRAKRRGNTLSLARK